MLLIETPVNCIAGILESDRPIALVPVEGRNHAKEIAVAVSDGGFGVAVILDRSERLFVLVVGDASHTTELRCFVRRYDAEIATDRHIDIEKVFCWPGWLTAMAHSQGANIGITLYCL
jgi:hypothetical protein